MDGRTPDAPLTYARYLKVPQLLDLQTTLTDAHDEMQFIVVHQVFELWFRLLIFELESIRAAVAEDRLRPAVTWFARGVEIIETATRAFDVIETMRPRDFLEFRSVLNPASGFQSRQFREIEFLSGLKEERYVRGFASEPAEAAILHRRLAEPSLWDVFVGVLARRGFRVDSDATILDGLLRGQREAEFADLGELIEAYVAYDEQISHWRRRHVLMVERIIGSRPGTGQTTMTDVFRDRSGDNAAYFSGVDYLRSTLSKKFFPLLWESRTLVERG